MPLPEKPVRILERARDQPLKASCSGSVIVAGWWGLSSFDYESYLSPPALTQRLHDAGLLGPVPLIGSMVGAVIIPPIPSLPLDLAAGLTNISLMTFTLATLFGMAPPTFALTYLGSSVVSAQWPVIVGGVVMVALFLAMPKLLTRHGTSRVARLLLGPPPTSAGSPREIPLLVRCVGCGASVPGA